MTFRAQAADGSWLYPLEGYSPDGREWLNGAKVIDQSDGTYSGRKYFLVVPEDGDRLFAQYRTKGTREQTNSWTLQPNVAPSAIEPLLPKTTDLAGIEKLGDDYGRDYEGDALAERWYRPIFIEHAGTVELFDLQDYVDFPLDLVYGRLASPVDLPTRDSMFWLADPAYLVFGDHWASMFPGRLVVNREQFGKAIDLATPGIQIWSHKFRDGIIEGHAEVRYEDGRQHTVQPAKPPRARKLPPSFQRVSTKRLDFSYRIPTQITAVSYQEALAEYDQAVADMVAQINTVPKLVVCAHCGGDGLIIKESK